MIGHRLFAHALLATATHLTVHHEGTKVHEEPAGLRALRGILVQPRGLVVNATGEHPFATPWPADAVVSAKTGGAADRRGRDVRWLVGHVRRGARAWIFVSCVFAAGGRGDDLPALAAVDLAAKALGDEGVLR